MYKLILIFVLMSSCYANNVIIETSIVNRFAPKFGGKYNTVLQGPEISLNVCLNDSLPKNLNVSKRQFIMVGLGLGPMLMNGFVPSNDSFGALGSATTNIWLDCYYVFDLISFNALLCIGGKLGVQSDKYRLVCDIDHQLIEYIKDYEVWETYYGALGTKFIFGFKHFRFVINGLINFGKKEDVEYRSSGFSYFSSEKKAVITKTTTIASFQIDAGILVFF